MGRRTVNVYWALTDIAPDGCRVVDVTIPDDGIYELDQAGEGHPDHIEARSSIPALEMPWHRDQAHNEAKESERRKQRIGQFTHVDQLRVE